MKITEFKYILLNKPKGYICALSDPRHKVITDLIEDKIKGLHIVGRLDKDTTGIIVLTNDGEYTHNSTHPKKHVKKKYFVTLERPVEDSYQKQIEDGMKIDHDETQLKPGLYEKVSENTAYLTIYQGKKHQVKKMFAALGNWVLELHRVEYDEWNLDELKIEPGKYIFVDKK